MKKMTSNEIRKSWIEFFEQKQHTLIPPASLIPVDDNSLLWINSGVATLKDYFSGKKNPPSNRLVNAQKAIRTNDFFNVGHTSRHHTFFEMLGNFSIGDYFKIDAINFAYELLTKVWEIDPSLLWITVFKDDIDSYNQWIKNGINPNQIIKCDESRNFWDIGSGPCGPCSEIYYDRGPKFDPNNIGEKLILEDIENDRYIEIWNIVFSQYNNDGKNNYSELARKNIDTGAGIERLASISQNVPTNFDTDLFLPIIKSIEKYSNQKYDLNAYFNNNQKQNKVNFSYRVICDHFRAATFAIADGAIPNNKERGYIIRRLIRRAYVHFQYLNINNTYQCVNDIVVSIINTMNDYYSYLNDKKDTIINILINEIELFNKTLNQGFKLMNNSISNNQLNAETIFKLVSTFGFPFELIEEITVEKNIQIDKDGYLKLYEHHQQISNGNKNEIGMDIQSKDLLELNLESTFLYDKFEIDSKIIAIFDDQFNEVNCLNNQNGYIVFDNTIFYATSGGQIHDTGFVNTYFVDNVIKAPNRQHLHHVLNANLKLHDKVHLTINVDDRKKNCAHHSSEHLLQAALQKSIDKNIKQNGSFKTPKKFTFDFELNRKLTDEELINIENLINNWINDHIQVDIEFMNLDEAKSNNVIGYFENVYKKINGLLRVVNILKISKELCGGTHVNNTSDIEIFKIVNLTSKGSNLWRIEAISTLDNYNNYLNFINDEFINKCNEFTNEFKNLNLSLNELNNLINKYKDIYQLNKSLFAFKKIFNDFVNEMDTLKNKLIIDKQLMQAKEIKQKFTQINSLNKYIFVNDLYLDKSILIAIDDLINENKFDTYAILFVSKNKIQYIFATNKSNKDVNLLNVVNSFNQLTQGKAGGSNHFVRGGCDLKYKNQIDDFMNKIGFYNA